MAQFQYKARDARGVLRTGSVAAKDKKEAKANLARMRMRVMTLKRVAAEGEDLSAEETPILGNFLYRDADGNVQMQLGSQAPGVKDIIVFTKQFATMLNSGVPMIQALGILSKQQPSKGFCKALKKVQNAVENGSTLSDSLAMFPDVFDTLYVAMVRAGEASGNLDTILVKLVTYIEKAAKIKDQVKSAMMYPVIVFFIAVGVISGLLIFVVPTFAEQYADTGRQLPALTQAVIDFSNFFVSYWMVMFGTLGVALVGFRLWVKTAKGRERFDGFILRAPVIGILLKKIAVGRFCSTMSSMLTSGVNLLEALTICAASSGNKTIEIFVLGIRTGLEKGSKFSEPLAEGGLFPDMVISMVTVGEATGALDDMLVKVSEFYEEEVDLAVQTMLSMIEPIMIVFIGGAVAFIVIAMYLPVFEMAGGIA